MATHVLLNNIDHRDLRVETGHGASLGDDVMFALTFPAEFRNVQANYPIVFSKTPGGEFQPLALFGFKEGQNLFLDGERWDATYIPMMIQRQPFLIGASADELMMHIDLDNPRVNRDRGEALFLPHGGTSEYLEQVNSTLLALHHRLQANPAFIAALLKHQLLEPFVLDIELDDGSENRLSGFYAINEERLRELDDGAVLALARGDHLEPIYMMLASVTRFRNLIDRVNRVPAADR